MIVDLPDTTTAAISARLVRLRADTGSMALSRVLTLLVVVDAAHADAAIETANDASRQHPCRIIVVIAGSKRGAARLDGQIRVGGDAGASEVVVLRLFGRLASHGRAVVTPLLLADSPIVAWWPANGPHEPSKDPIGMMAQRRVTDAARFSTTSRTVLRRLSDGYAAGDSDLAWSRITLWRGLLTAALDQPPYEPVTSAVVVAAADSPSGDLLAGWLAARLKCPVSIARARSGSGIVSVRLERDSGSIDLVRPVDGNTATLAQPGQPVRTLALAHRGDAECLADELRRLDPDEVYHDALVVGLRRCTVSRQTASEAVRAGRAPSVAEAERTAKRLRRAARASTRSAMVEAAPMPPKVDDPEVVKQAAKDKLAEVKERRS
ncbi:MAG TPA: glucose-6-phosphate dehydrogenase assembly protein OpcA [Ornithinibacter sp.]|jgi:glucose-6-phosphate dehydrogenase assembly protein OpcA|nr:glucose-6-phosphate dehydrogenase assembly protein OpcA [Ornithinibacter sp.]HOB79725.1 glucose-6-phosphate dehydrogenase assembly protein OpcA [Ornithinibacter sp.]HOT57401.1 glucose-6-phosphate dehydrogenase assembly protein OpcA [Ornithinibacter sp.]HPV89525.1 glucose-6-phosphate dehydrogenase assembly protein OpcA [Ornithinibacter sp.]HQA13746.1 glucose-6-phosphate dehydrogenase assembly protein OpcA [Ornithinibacter sp.]